MSECGNEFRDFADDIYDDDVSGFNDFRRGGFRGETFQSEPFENTRIVREFAEPRTYTDYVWYEIKYVGPFRSGAVVDEPSRADLARNERIAERISHNNGCRDRDRCSCQRRDRCCCNRCRGCR